MPHCHHSLLRGSCSGPTQPTTSERQNPRSSRRTLILQINSFVSDVTVVSSRWTNRTSSMLRPHIITSGSHYDDVLSVAHAVPAAADVSKLVRVVSLSPLSTVNGCNKDGQRTAQIKSEKLRRKTEWDQEQFIRENTKNKRV